MSKGLSLEAGLESKLASDARLADHESRLAALEAAVSYDPPPRCKRMFFAVPNLYSNTTPDNAALANAAQYDDDDDLNWCIQQDDAAQYDDDDDVDWCIPHDNAAQYDDDEDDYCLPLWEFLFNPFGRRYLYVVGLLALAAVVLYFLGL